jgi:membrane protein implicated in regulation of membrane protease activity
MPELSLETLNCVYLGLFFLGLGYAIVIVITGGLSSIDMPDVNVDVPQIDLPGDVDIPGASVDISGASGPVGGIDAPDVSVSPLSPITIATFITVFGGLGVLSTQFFNLDPRLSLVVATVGGLAVAVVMFLLYSRVLIGSQASTQISRSELVGIEAEVTVPIGEAASGQVSYATKAGRMQSMARSMDGRPIPRGQLVTIVRVSGSQVLVRPIVDQAEAEHETGL